MKKSLLIKFLSIFCFGLFSWQFSTAQLSYVETAGGSSSSNRRGPCTSCGFQRYVGVYPASEVASVFPTGDSVRAMSFNLLTPEANSVNGNLIVLMSNTTDVDYQKGSDWPTAITGMDTVYNGAFTVPTTAGFLDIVFQNAFGYSGDGVYLAFEWTTTGTLAGGEATYAANTAISPGMVRYFNNTGHVNALGAGAVWRVQLRLAYTTPSVDLALTNPGTSSSACGATSGNFDFNVTNAGLNSVDTVFYHYNLNGPGTNLSVDTFADITITSGNSALISNTFSLPSNGNYFYDAYLIQPGDSISINDTVSDIKVANLGLINTFPYSENFDGASQGWSSNSDGGPDDWQLGLPAGTIINGAASGTNSWVTSLSGNYTDSQTSWVNSPCFDFTNVADPYFSARIWWEIETGWDAAILQASTDDGATWNTVGGLNTGVNWYNNSSANLVNGLPAAWSGEAGSGSGGWVTAEHPLLGYGGMPSVRLRILFQSDGSANAEGFAFDDVEIRNQCLTDISTIPDPLSTSSNRRGPATGSDFQRCVSIYTDGEMASKVASGPICSIGWVLETAAPEQAIGDIKIFLRNTTDQDYQDTTDWPSIISNMNMYYDGPLTIDTVTGGYDIQLDSSFNYTGAGVYVAFEWTASTTASTEATYFANTSIANGMVRNFSATAHSDNLGALAPWRPVVRFGAKLKDNDITASLNSSPSSGCGLGASETFTIQVSNNGITNQTDSFAISYELNGPGGLSTGTSYVQSLPFAGSTNVSFSLDLSTPGLYSFRAFSDLANDEFRANDTTISIDIGNFPQLNASALPYTQDFESGTGDWATLGTSSDWEYGTPSGTIINSAASGNNAWVTNLSSNYRDGHIGFLVSPCFDLSSISSSYEFNANVWWDIETGWDGAIVEGSTDGGLTWARVGSLNSGTNWYNSNDANLVAPLTEAWSGEGASGSGGWVNAVNEIDSFVGSSTAQFRVAFYSDGATNNEGFAIDDISLVAAVGVPVADFTFSISGLTVDFTDASSNGPNSWLWDFGDGNSSISQDPTHVYDSAGTYNVCLIASNSFGPDTFCADVSVTTGIQDELAEKVKVYPVPASDHINLSIEDMYEGELVISILDAFGRKVYETEVLEESTEIKKSFNVKNLESGMYFISIQNDSHRILKRFIVN